MRCVPRYAKEGIDGTKISYEDNQPLLDLLLQTNPLGLLAILDEESNFPKATDSTMIQKFHAAFKGHKDYTRPRGNDDYFALTHYAGTVQYIPPLLLSPFLPLPSILPPSLAPPPSFSSSFPAILLSPPSARPLS